ncbi:MAG: peroxiredoxin [Proteobacteria bacterium]|nr:peroxiredoxin [Pseudomonadota bacterium]MDA0993917.1 peroxiredoxin [Pseudomonadota bacterium]
MLKVGDVAPEFILPDENGNDISLTKLLHESAVILYFYPADFTPGCTKEACAIRDMHDEILSVGLSVIGVSPQDGESHRRFKDEHDLPFTLVCDTEKVAIRMYDADGPLGFGVRRITYLVNQGQKIQAATQANLLIGQHTEFIKKAVMLRETAGIKVRSASD